MKRNPNSKRYPFNMVYERTNMATGMRVKESWPVKGWVDWFNVYNDLFKDTNLKLIHGEGNGKTR